MITNRPHLHGLARLKDLVAPHPTIHLDTTELVVPESERVFVTDAARTESVTFPVMVVGPSVRVVFVLQCPAVAPASVYICTPQYRARNLSASGVAGVGEVPVASYEDASAIHIRLMVTHWSHASSFTCVVDRVTVHPGTLHRHTVYCVASVFERVAFHSRLCASIRLRLRSLLRASTLFSPMLMLPFTQWSAKG